MDDRLQLFALMGPISRCLRNGDIARAREYLARCVPPALVDVTLAELLATEPAR